MQSVPVSTDDMILRCTCCTQHHYIARYQRRAVCAGAVCAVANDCIFQGQNRKAGAHSAETHHRRSTKRDLYMWVRTTKRAGDLTRHYTVAVGDKTTYIDLYCRSRSRCSQAVMRKPKPNCTAGSACASCLLKGARTNEAYRLPSCSIEARSLIQPRQNATNGIQSLDGLAR